MKYKWLWLLVLLVAAGDIATTLYGMGVGASEGNVIAEEAMNQHGQLPAMIALKVFAITIGLVLQYYMPQSK